MGKKYKKLGEILIENGVLSEDQLKAALSIQKEEGGLLGEILLKHGFESEEDIVKALVKQREYLFVKNESPAELLKKRILIFISSLFLAAVFLFFSDVLPFVKNMDMALYGALLNTEYHLRRLPAAVNDILLVTIDDETLAHTPHQWPYPRTDFATVIENLKKSDPAVIAFDFSFYGNPSYPENSILQNALKSDQRIIAATNINQQGELTFLNTLVDREITSGIVTKIQDPDDVIRRCLTYLISDEETDTQKAFLSWEMQILRIARKIDVQSFKVEDTTLEFQNPSGEKWMLPIDPDTKSFLIRFRARTHDFPRISFHQVLRGNFDPALAKDKIIMIGIASELLQDMQHTSVGWMVGITLNANAFLTLHTRDFLRNMPRYSEYMVLILGVMVGAFLMMFLDTGKAFAFILVEITLFLISSYILLLYGYVWNYALFVLLVPALPLLSKKLIYYFRQT